MTCVLVTGGTGALGRLVVDRLRTDGYTPRVMSRSTAPKPIPRGTEWAQADLSTGDGVRSAVTDVDIVAHLASNPFRNTNAIDVDGTKRLLKHAEEFDVSHLLYISIVGIDQVPLGYYQHKLAAEAAITDSSVPWTVVRATQFHSLFETVLTPLRWLPIWALPTDWKFQPIAPEDVADHIHSLITTRETGHVPEIGGPAVLTVREIARTWTAVRGWRRPLLRLPLPGQVAAGFRNGFTTTPDNHVGTITWQDWLETRYTNP